MRSICAHLYVSSVSFSTPHATTINTVKTTRARGKIFSISTESGAVFTIGKSYLSENHQSYFFIRNDPIRKLIAGANQSAVICGKFKRNAVEKNRRDNL